MAQIITMRLPFMNKSLASRQLMNHRRQLQFRNNVDQLRSDVAMDTRGSGGQTQHRMASTYLLHTRLSSIMSACSQLRPSMSIEAFVRGIGTTSGSGDDGMKNGKSGDQELAEPFSKSSINTQENETFGQPIHRFGSSHKREQASQQFDAMQHGERHQTANHYQSDLAAQHHADVYNHMPSVSLSSCMQSQVPQPYGKSPPHLNMPGGMNRIEVSLSFSM